MVLKGTGIVIPGTNPGLWMVQVIECHSDDEFLGEWEGIELTINSVYPGTVLSEGLNVKFEVVTMVDGAQNVYRV